MDKPFTILPDAPAMPGAKASPFYVQKEKKGEQKSYRTITHWHDELECLTILDGTLDFQLNESVISLQKGSTLIVLPGAIYRNLPKPEDTVFMRILANPALLTANEEIREKLVRPLLQNASREYFYIPAGSDDAPKVQRLLRELQASKDSKEPAAPFRTVALIHMLLYYLYRSFPPMLNALPQPSFSDRAVQKDMVHFIYEHYQEDHAGGNFRGRQGVPQQVLLAFQDLHGKLADRLRERLPSRGQPLASAVHGHLRGRHRLQLRLHESELFHQALQPDVPHDSYGI